ncbi:MAG: hypothetical protein RL670_529, partial [Actinomycetota bacterium]
MRLDLALVHRGLARSRNQAAGLISDGRVLVAQKTVIKASTEIADETEITITPALDLVGRAGFKLLRALETFGAVQIAGKTCLDVGASTGGFTQVLLNAQAARVISLDVGHDQLVPELVADPRVVNIEGYNARLLKLDDLRLLSHDAELTVDLVVTDLSFISLELVLPALVATAPQAEMILLVKPQFEVGRAGVGSGVVNDRRKHNDVLIKMVRFVAELGWATRGIVDSGLPGSHGNVEYLLWISP